MIERKAILSDVEDLRMDAFKKILMPKNRNMGASAMKKGTPLGITGVTSTRHDVEKSEVLCHPTGQSFRKRYSFVQGTGKTSEDVSRRESNTQGVLRARVFEAMY